MHTLYTGYDITEPGGQLIRCHGHCGIENRSHHTTGNKGQQVKVVCRKCNSYCKVDKVALDLSTPLGARHIVKTTFPQTILPTLWVFNTPKTHTPAPKKSGRVASTKGLVITSSTLPSSICPTPTDPAPISHIPLLSAPPPTLTRKPTSHALSRLAPPTVITRSSSLPQPPSKSDVHPLVVGPPTPQQTPSHTGLLRGSPDIPPLLTSSPTITPRSAVLHVDPSVSGLKIRLPARGSVAPAIARSPLMHQTITHPPPMPHVITHSQSMPQMGLQQRPLKREYPMIELSTSAKRQRQKKKNTE